MGKPFHYLLAGVLFVAFIPLFVTTGAKYEGQFFPVVAKLEILRVLPEDASHSLVYVRFNKLRDCQYLGIAWFSNEGDFLDRRAIDLRPSQDSSDASDPNRPTGEQISGPWRIAMPAGEILAKSVVTLTHQCHPLYITRTQIFP